MNEENYDEASANLMEDEKCASYDREKEEEEINEELI